MKLNIFIAASATCLLATVAGSPAQAATLSYSASYGPTGLTGSAQSISPALNFNKFDGSLGTLTGVTIDLGVNGAFVTQFENSSFSAQTVTLQTLSSVGFAGAGVTPFSATAAFSVTRSVSSNDFFANFGGTSGFTVNGNGSGQAQYNVAAGNLAAFIGGGNYVGTLTGSMATSQTGGIASLSTTAFASQVSGVSTITYIYTPGIASGVPEPASWAMMIAGFGLIGGAMRRRRVAVSFG